MKVNKYALWVGSIVERTNSSRRKGIVIRIKKTGCVKHQPYYVLWFDDNSRAWMRRDHLWKLL